MSRICLAPFVQNYLRENANKRPAKFGLRRDFGLDASPKSRAIGWSLL
jgi:hypothetical protein